MVDVLIASTLAIFGIGMSPVPAAFVGGTLVAAAAFAFVLDFAKSPCLLASSRDDKIMKNRLMGPDPLMGS